MCVRLFPDFVVATDVKRSMSNIVYLNDLKFTDAYMEEKFQEELDHIFVSIPECIERQEFFAESGVNVFTGYKDHDWDENDYQSYFKNLRNYFELVEGSGRLYRVKIRENQNNCENNTISELCNYICSQLLTQGAYSPLLMDKFDLFK